MCPKVTISLYSENNMYTLLVYSCGLAYNDITISKKIRSQRRLKIEIYVGVRKKKEKEEIDNFISKLG